MPPVAPPVLSEIQCGHGPQARAEVVTAPPAGDPTRARDASTTPDPLYAPRTCPVCCLSLRLFATIPTRKLDEVFFTPQLRAQLPELRYSRCVGCGSLWSTDARRDPRLLGELYAALPDAYWSALGENIALHARLESELLALAPGPTLYDVGCGDGRLLRNFSGYWEKHGLEPGRAAVAQCAARGLDVRCGSASELELRDVADALTCIDVLEHLPDPRRELRAMANMLRPNGVLALFTGDAGAPGARLAGSRWEYLHWVGHISVLSRRAVTRALHDAGLHVLRHQTLSYPGAPSWGRFLAAQLQNAWRRLRGRAYRRGPACHDHQLIVARKVHAGRSIPCASS